MGGGGPLPAVPPEQGEGRLPGRRSGFDTEAWLVVEPS